MCHPVSSIIFACVLIASAGSFTPAFQEQKELTKTSLVNWLRSINELQSKGQIDSNSTVEISVDGILNSTCRLTQVNLKQNSSDQRLFPLAQSLVSAFSDSGLLAYVGYRNGQTLPEGTCTAEPLRLTFKSDSAFVDMSLTSKFPSADAERVARGYDLLFRAGSHARYGTPEGELLELSSATSVGEEVTIRFHAPRDKFRSIVSRKLDSQEKKPEQ